MTTQDRKFLMTEAHKLAKTYKGDYSACLSLALKNVYAIHAQYKNNPTITIRLSYSQTKLRKEAKKDGLNYNPNTKTWSIKTTSLEDFEAAIYNWKGVLFNTPSIPNKVKNNTHVHVQKTGYGSQEHKGLANWDFD